MMILTYCKLANQDAIKKNFKSAETSLRKAIVIAEKLNFDNCYSDALLLMYSKLATLLACQGNCSETKSCYEKVITIHPPPNDDSFDLIIAQACNNLGSILAGQNKFTQAISHIRRAGDIFQSQLGIDDLRTQSARHNLEVIYQAQEKGLNCNSFVVVAT